MENQFCNRAARTGATLPNSTVIMLKYPLFRNRIAPLAQLDRASDYESEGREFESLRARHTFLSNFPNKSISMK